MIVNLSEQHSILNSYVAELRDVTVQQDRMRFRRNLERIAEIMAYEISKQLEWVEKEVQTPLARTNVLTLKQQPIIGNILRAGVPMHNGLLNIFDKADNAFISAYRKHDEKGNFQIALGYVSCPDLNGRTLILADPMLATGSSMVATIKELKALGDPKDIHLVCAIACQPGVEYVMEQVPEITIWAAAVDPELNELKYIVPGLGDAGDLAFGVKVQH